jgi:hypothetical protein
MKLLSSLLLAGVCLNGCALLTGCGGYQQAVVPDVAAQSSLGTLQGSVFGGHAPLVGSHVYVLEAGTSSQCSTLFTYATNTGVPSTASSNAGTQPLDTATAAINIARHPAGVTSNVASQSTWVNTLYSLPSGNVPFTPSLTSAPTDFSIAVSYPQSLNSSLGSPEGLAVDGSGNVWIDNAGSGYITALSPLGAPLRTYQSAYTPGYVAIDPSNNIWWGPRSGTQAVTRISNNGTLLSGGGYVGAYAGGFTNPSYAFVPAIDGAGNLYLPDDTTPTTGCTRSRS